MEVFYGTAKIRLATKGCASGNDVHIKDGTDVNSIMRDRMYVNPRRHMRDLYDIEISDSTISRITDKIFPIVKVWQEQPLEEASAVVFMDAIHYHVRSEGLNVK